MKTYPDCIPCFLKHSLEVANMVTGDGQLQEKIMKRVLDVVSDVRFEEPAPVTTARMHRAIRELTGEPDPFRRFKHVFNQIALDLYPRMKARVEESEDRFESAVRIAIAGNTIDCILAADLDMTQLLESIEDSLSSPLDGAMTLELSSSIDKAERILYIGDNAGELVFDLILLDEMPKERVTFAVRGLPILNDATMKDAADAGLTEEVHVVDTGSDIPGVVLSDCSTAFRKYFDEADLVIAKGQGNYETLSEVDKSVFFLFKVKCPVVARDTGSRIGSAMIHHTVRGEYTQEI
jgi:uncharacterized protein with ATP-grasp and redox domains